MAYFKFEEKQIYYSETGQGKPLLLLHGNTASSRMFYEIAKAFKEQHNVILIDFLGHGDSDRLLTFPADLWYYEALQVIAFLQEKNYENVDIIGCSGGAIVALNVALEIPQRIDHVIADSFEGECALAIFAKNLAEDREQSKKDEGSRFFYEMMHGDDWEHIVDLDTQAIVQHASEVVNFYHQPVSNIRAKTLLIGSKEDEYTKFISDTFFEDVYGAMLEKMSNTSMYLFSQGSHPAMLSNPQAFCELAEDFLNK